MDLVSKFGALALGFVIVGCATALVWHGSLTGGQWLGAAGALAGVSLGGAGGVALVRQAQAAREAQSQAMDKLHLLALTAVTGQHPVGSDEPPLPGAIIENRARRR